MDLNLISKQIQFMPDDQLAASVKNPNGVMPSYLALAELSRRQKIRSSAPQQEPQGTVADDVLQSLHSAGMQPQQPMQQGASMPQQMGIAGAPPQAPQGIAQAPGMARGGLVRGYGSGGPVAPSSADLDYIQNQADSVYGSDPQPQAQAQNPGGIAGLIASPPDQTSLSYNPERMSTDEAASTVRGLVGPLQDYSEELNGVRGLRQGLHKPTMSDLQNREALNIMASKDPYGGLAQASLDAHDTYDKQQQSYFNNAFKTYEESYKVKDNLDKRATDIQKAIESYWQTSNLLNIQTETGKENARFHQGTLDRQLFDSQAKLLKATNPTELYQLATGAQALRNNPNNTPEQKARYSALLDQTMGAVKMMQDQKANEEAQKAKDSYKQATDVARINEQAKIAAKMADHEALNLSPEAIKQLAIAYHAKGPEALANLGQGAAIGAIKTQIINLSASMFGGKGSDGNERDAFTIDSTNNKGDVKSLNGITTTLDALEGFEKAAGKNLDQFLNLSKNLPDTGIPWLNTPVRGLSNHMVGDEWLPAVNAARNTGLREIARVTNNPSLSGVLSDSARKEVMDFSPENATLPQIKHVVQVLRTDMKNVHDSMAEQKKAIQDRIQARTVVPGSKPKETEAPKPETVKVGDKSYTVGQKVMYQGKPATITGINNGKVVLEQ